MMRRKLIAVPIASTLLTLASGCQSPEAAYQQEISQLGFIAFTGPLASGGVGTVLKGSAKDNYLAASSSDCFSDTVWSDNATDLPTQDQSVSFGFTADANVVLSSGTPGVTLNVNATDVKSVQVSFGGAAVEQLDEFKYGEYYRTQMPAQCQALLDSDPFINTALKVATMSFVFKDDSNGSIKLTADVLKSLVTIDAGVTWQITDDWTLTVTTPRYVGYTLAKMIPGDRSGNIALYSSSANDNGQWMFGPVGQPQ